VARSVSGWLLAEQLQRATDRVLACQGALWAAQDLDTVQIDQVENRALHGREVDVVDVHTDARFEVRRVIALADAADVSHETAPDTAEGQEHARRLRRDVTDVGLGA